MTFMLCSAHHAGKYTEKDYRLQMEYLILIMKCQTFQHHLITFTYEAEFSLWTRDHWPAGSQLQYFL